MDYQQQIKALQDNPPGLEQLYRAAGRAGEAAAFEAALHQAYQSQPEHTLLAAWHYRLEAAAPEGRVEPAGLRVNWPLAILLSVINGLALGGLMLAPDAISGPAPAFLLLWGPLVGLFLIAFLALDGRLPLRDVLVSALVLVALAAYAFFSARSAGANQQYAVLMALHLPLLAGIAVIVSLLGLRSTADERFAVLSKALEVLITGGIYVGVGGILGMLTLGMFAALSVELPSRLVNVLFAAGGGLIPVLAVATTYDPRLRPLQQRFEQGLGKVISTLLRLALPLCLLVMLVYICVIPFNFMAPFRNRDLLIVYNAMLFAVMALLLGVTPAAASSMSERQQKYLRAGIIAMTAMTLLVGLYAVSATAFRTAQGGLTLNRLTVMGWNVINIALLALLLVRQARAGLERWLTALHRTFSDGIFGYVAWTLFLIVATPLIF